MTIRVKRHAPGLIVYSELDVQQYAIMAGLVGFILPAMMRAKVLPNFGPGINPPLPGGAAPRGPLKQFPMPRRGMGLPPIVVAFQGNINVGAGGFA